MIAIALVLYLAFGAAGAYLLAGEDPASLAFAYTLVAELWWLGGALLLGGFALAYSRVRARRRATRPMPEVGDDIRRDGGPVAFTDADLDRYVAEWRKGSKP